MRRILLEKFFSLAARHSWADGICRRVLLPAARDPEMLLRYYRDIYAPRILSTLPVVCGDGRDAEIHVLTCHRDVVSAMWCLKTFYHFGRHHMGLVIHDDGSLLPSDVELFRKHFVNCRVVSKQDNEARVAEQLRQFPACRRFRVEAFELISLRLFDMFVSSATKNIVGLDSDVLFFREPVELLAHIGARRGCFMTDCSNSYSVGIGALERGLGREVLRKFNAGLHYIPKEWYDLDLVERVLQLSLQVEGKPAEPGDDQKVIHLCWREQTAMCAIFSAQGATVARLSDTYQISMTPITEHTVSHHFVSDASRPDFFRRGIKCLAERGCLKQMGAL